ncbi:MAG: hypothetical protein JRF63_09040 [Deltaproteobacteria bacterium]|nr:hypothetical protein [Deltaproteobacteria bacterium]
MVHFKRPGEKACESVTFRLTIDERSLLDHVAGIEGRTLTDLFRELLSTRAAELGIHDAPPPLPRRGPGRPRKPSAVLPAQSPRPAPIARDAGSDQLRARRSAVTFAELIRRFEIHFADRSESTRAELAETIALVTDESAGEPLLARWMPLLEIGSDRLERIRDHLKDLELRVAQKNLHLTYLRMLFAFAVKEPDMDVDVVPEQDLAPLTARETGATWSVPPAPPEGDR